MKKFVIIDALALAYKAYFAFMNRPLMTKKGEPTSAVYGFLTQIVKIMEDTKPDYMAVAFDSKEKTFRHERYDLYKSSRSDMPEDMIPQLQRIKDIVEAFGLPLYILPGYEADDLIGTAVRIAEENGYRAFAVTPDKDYVQLVTDNINVIIPGKSSEENEVIDRAKVFEKYGFTPEQMTDYLGIVGDKSDDIPGVKGVGEKTAVPLIQEFGSLENIYDNLDKIGKKGVVKKFETDRENAFLSKELATIVRDVPYDIDIEKAKFGSPDMNKLLSIIAELEFRNIGNRIRKIFEEETEPLLFDNMHDMKEFDKTSVEYILINDVNKAKELSDLLSRSELFVFDTETDSLDTLTLNLAGASFAIDEGKAWFVATAPETMGKTDRLTITEFVDIFREPLENAGIKKVCQNGKFDIGVMKRIGIDVKNFWFDTMLASYVLNPDDKHGMNEISERMLDYSPIKITSLYDPKKNPEKVFEAPVSELTNYAAEDADITLRLFNILSGKLKEENLVKVAYDIEFPLVEVLEKMERTGIKLDEESLIEMSKELGLHLEQQTREIHSLAGEEFNVNSTQQLQHILFDKLGLPPTKKTKTGFSTDARSLESLRGKHEIIDIMLNYRQLAKLKSTYTDALPRLIHPVTGRLHTTFNQTVASTGRLSSLDPNLQNIPIRTELGREIRKAFVPTDENHTIFSADYSQIELRIMASICGDENLVSAFRNNEDIHRSTAALVFEVQPEEVTQDMRRKAKEVNFGILYGIGAFGLKTRLGISQKHAKEVIDTYFKKFPGVQKFIDESVKAAQDKGFAETLSGRRRFLKNINSSNRVVRQFEERVAVNMPIQGTAADMIKLAMINVNNKMESLKMRSKMVLQVHDELVFDANLDELEKLQTLVKNEMENAFPLDVPVTVEYGSGKNWLEAH